MNGHTEEQAQRMGCCQARNVDDEHLPACISASCMAWRWIPLEADAAFLAAVAKQMNLENPDTQKPFTHAAATRYVTKNHAAFKPFLGYCGLAGKP